MENELGIQITITIDGDEITHATANSFEMAEQELGSLERWYKKEQDKTEAQAELALEE